MYNHIGNRNQQKQKGGQPDDPETDQDVKNGSGIDTRTVRERTRCVAHDYFQVGEGAQYSEGVE